MNELIPEIIPDEKKPLKTPPEIDEDFEDHDEEEEFIPSKWRFGRKKFA